MKQHRRLKKSRAKYMSNNNKRTHKIKMYKYKIKSIQIEFDPFSRANKRKASSNERREKEREKILRITKAKHNKFRELLIESGLIIDEKGL